MGEIQARLSARLADLKVAAHDFGLRSDHHEMRFLQSQIAVQNELGELVGTFAATVSEAAKTAHDAKLAAEVRLSSLKEEGQRLGQETIKQYAKELGKESIKWNIIREQKWNWYQNWIRVGVLTATVFVLIGVGWVARFEVDKPQVFGVEDCLDAPLMVTNSNGSFLGCPLSDFESPATMTQLNREYFHNSQ